jgi:hypothetical protein
MITENVVKMQSEVELSSDETLPTHCRRTKSRWMKCRYTYCVHMMSVVELTTVYVLLRIS